MALENLRDLYVDKLKDLYSAENQIIKALPRMIKGATSTELQQALQAHLTVTQTQAQRLEEITANLGERAKGKKCAGMEGLLEEGKELFKEKIEPDVLDAGIISAAQSVEHYEIAGYGTAVSWARLLGHEAAADLLQQSLEEEKEADQSLTTLAENWVNEMAADEDDDEEETDSQPMSTTSTWKA
jgi:ferritin-like metal-binding protein YciE